MKRVNYLLPALAFLCMFPMAILADDYRFPGGTGTADDPYQITTAEDLNAIRNYTQNPSVCFKIMNDIDLETYLGEGSWTPIGSTTDNAFTGTLDGNNKTISGLTMVGGSNGLGFFGRIQHPGTVKNMIFQNAYVEGGNWCGIICSTNGNWEKPGGSLIDCKVINSTIDGLECIGGIVGVNEGNIDGCQALGVFVSGTVNVAAISGFNQCTQTGRRVHNCMASGTVEGSKQVGGIIGFLALDQAAGDAPGVQNCANFCAVSVSEDAAGGIVGYQQGIKTTVIDNNFNSGKISGPGSGGIGGSPIDGIVQNCYSTGHVTAMALGAAIWSGGITGTSYQTIKGCYASGAITTAPGAGDSKAGGICGRNWPGLAVENCFYNKEGAAMNMGEGHNESDFDIKGFTWAEMTSSANMRFDAADKWQIVEGKTTPFFVNQTVPVVTEVCGLDGAKGTCTGNVTQLYALSPYGNLIELTSATITDGQWQVYWDETAVMEQDKVTIVAIEEGKMPSYGTISAVTNTHLSSMEETDIHRAIQVNMSGESIELSTPESLSTVRVSIYEAGSGMEIYAAQLKAGKQTISAANFARGVYVLTLRSGSENAVFKILK